MRPGRCCSTCGAASIPGCRSRGPHRCTHCSTSTSALSCSGGWSIAGISFRPCGETGRGTRRDRSGTSAFATQDFRGKASAFLNTAPTTVTSTPLHSPVADGLPGFRSASLCRAAHRPRHVRRGNRGIGLLGGKRDFRARQGSDTACGAPLDPPGAILSVSIMTCGSTSCFDRWPRRNQCPDKDKLPERAGDRAICAVFPDRCRS